MAKVKMRGRPARATARRAVGSGLDGCTVEALAQALWNFRPRQMPAQGRFEPRLQARGVRAGVLQLHQVGLVGRPDQTQTARRRQRRT